MKTEQTRYPRLTRAILRRLSREDLKDVALHGAGAGWNGLAYYADTVAFYKAHKADILALAKSTAQELSDGSMIAMIAGFGCLKNDSFSEDDIAEALYSGRGMNGTTIRNAMAWFALEEVARELNPDI